MALANDDTFQRGVNIQFQKPIKNETQIQTNFLRKLFSRKPLVEKQVQNRFVGPIEDPVTTPYGDRSGNNINAAAMRPNTPAGVKPQWRARGTKPLFQPLKVDCNRIDAKYVGMTVDALVDKYVELTKKEIARRDMQLTLRMLTETYIENPIIVDTRGADAAKNVSFGPSNNVLPTVATAGGVSKAPLTYKTFMALNTMFCNAMGLNTKKIEKTSMTFGDVERVAVFSNSGWNAFIAQNEHLGNRDFYGRPVEIKGYGVYEQFQGNIIVTIPDDAIPTWTNVAGDHGDRHIFDNASNALENAYLSFGKTYAAGKLNFLTGEKYTKGTNDTFGVTSGQHFFYLFYPDAFEMFEPQQFTVKPSVYDEQAKSLEKAIYVMQSLEGVRLYDHSIARVFFTGEFGKLDASV